MALYDYKCAKCGEVFEVLIGMTDMDETETCPKCGEIASKIPPTVAKPIIHQDFMKGI